MQYASQKEHEYKSDFLKDISHMPGLLLT